MKTNLHPLAFYAVFLCFTSLLSCSKSSISEPITPTEDTTRITPLLPTNKYDSIWVMDFVRNTVSSSITHFQYDTINKRYKGWSQTYTWYDSTFIIYNNDGSVKSLVQKKSETPNFRVTASVYTYNSNGLINKIYHKRFKDAGVDGSFDYSYYTSLPMDNINLHYSAYDSFTYNNQNKISAVYYKQTNTTSQTYPVFKSIVFDYPAGDSLISTATINQHATDEKIESSRQLYFTYNKYKNPYYLLGQRLGILGGLNIFTDISLVPVFADARDANKILSISPYLCSSLNFKPDFRYKYNTDSLPVKNAPNTDFAEGVEFVYKKIRQ